MVAKKVEDRYQTMTRSDCRSGSAAARVRTSRSTCSSHSIRSSTTGLTDFLKDISLAPANARSSTKKSAEAARSTKNKKKLLLIGGGILGVLVLLAGLVVSSRTKDGTLVVTVNEPDAEVQVLSEEGKVEITRKGEKGPITISVDPGKHRLKVQKDGFTVLGRTSRSNREASSRSRRSWCRWKNRPGRGKEAAGFRDSGFRSVGQGSCRHARREAGGSRLQETGGVESEV